METEVKSQSFKPNEEFLKILLDMGITRAIAEKALRETNNTSIDLAASRALEIHESCTDDAEGAQWYWDSAEECKMSLVVNESLNMSPGKLAAQVAHGALALYRQLIENPAHMINVANWVEYGETKIVLKSQDESELQALSEEAQSVNLPCTLISDAGRTEVAPGSITVLAIFGPVDRVDSVTKKLRLL